VKLAYLDLAPGEPLPGTPGAVAAGEAVVGPAGGAPAGGGVPAVVLHREAEAAPAGPVGLVRATGLAGRVVFPFGGYAFYPSGMEVGGVCWYRVLPGYEGTDPISLATAVVQVCDLLDDLDLDRLLLVGFGQGAVVALGAALVRPDRVGSAVAVDPWPGHVALLPPASVPSLGGAPDTGEPAPGERAPAADAVPGPSVAGAAAPVGGAPARSFPPVLLAGTAPESSPGLARVRDLLAGRGVAAGTWCPSEGSGEDQADEALAGAVRAWSAAARNG
jgi:pimeloyl-ACP methyl ester carboxylesterase